MALNERETVSMTPRKVYSVPAAALYCLVVLAAVGLTSSGGGVVIGPKCRDSRAPYRHGKTCGYVYVSSPALHAALRYYEGFSPFCYLDSRCFWTRYFGHLVDGSEIKRRPTSCDTCVADARAVGNATFYRDVREKEAYLNKLMCSWYGVLRPPLELAQHQYDALLLGVFRGDVHLTAGCSNFSNLIQDAVRRCQHQLGPTNRRCVGMERMYDEGKYIQMNHSALTCESTAGQHKQCVRAHPGKLQGPCDESFPQNCSTNAPTPGPARPPPKPASPPVRCKHSLCGADEFSTSSCSRSSCNVKKNSCIFRLTNGNCQYKCDLTYTFTSGSCGWTSAPPYGQCCYL